MFSRSAAKVPALSPNGRTRWYRSQQQQTEKTFHEAPLFDTVLFQHEAHRACALLYVNSMASGTCAAKSEAHICKVRHRGLKLLRKVTAPLSEDLREVLRRHNDRRLRPAD